MSGINIFSEGIILRDFGITSRYIKANADKFIAAADITRMDVNIILTDDLFIKTINRSFRNKNKATDVISFPPDNEGIPGSAGIKSAGEIYISLDRAAAQAEKYGVAFKDEVNRLLAHGILHLAGYDHEISLQEELRMSEKENLLLESIRKPARFRS